MEKEFHTIDDVLHAGEEIVWTAKKKASFFLICGLFFVFFSIFFLLFDLSSNLPGSPLSGLIILYCISVIFLFIKDRIIHPTRYFITNRRVLETKGKCIVKEIELSRFGGRPLQEFIGKRIDYYENDIPVFDITVYDPITSETLMKFDNLSYSDTRRFESLRYMIVCKFCGTACSPEIKYCNECGNPIL
jgi:hypothetical protein